MNKNFTVWGFKINLKNFLITLAIGLAFVGVLLILEFGANVSISWYGFIIGLGFLVAMFFATKLMQYRNLPSDFAYDLIWWVFPFSIIGARIYYVLCSLNEFSSFWEIFAVWNGGLAIYGGIIGGLIGLIICCLIKKKSIISATDVAAPCLILAQAIGRWGNFINQEVYGFQITNPNLQWFPFGVFITKNGLNEWYLATFFYESILSLIGFFILVTLLRKVKWRGITTYTYLIYYGIIRFFLESLRVQRYVLNIPGTNFPISIAVSLICVIAGATGICLLFIKDINRKKQSLK